MNFVLHLHFHAIFSSLSEKVERSRLRWFIELSIEQFSLLFATWLLRVGKKGKTLIEITSYRKSVCQRHARRVHISEWWSLIVITTTLGGCKPPRWKNYQYKQFFNSSVIILASLDLLKMPCLKVPSPNHHWVRSARHPSQQLANLYHIFLNKSNISSNISPLTSDLTGFEIFRS